MILIEEVNDTLGTNLSDEEVDTIGGWFLSQKYDVVAGDSIQAEGYSFTITDMEGHQILFLEVKKN